MNSECTPIRTSKHGYKVFLNKKHATQTKAILMRILHKKNSRLLWLELAVSLSISRSINDFSELLPNIIEYKKK